MNDSMDRVVAEWLHEGPDHGPREGLERALAATRRIGQRPGWTFSERWLPVELTVARTSMRPILVVISIALLIVALLAAALFVGSQRRQPPLPFGPARNGAVVFTQGGDLFIADQLGGTPRTLVAGPDIDRYPVFSRQGDRIAFVREEGRWRLMTVRPDGSDVQELARDIGFYISHLDWSPDGSALVASAPGTGDEQAHVLRSDGTGSRELELPDGYIVDASWRPDGRHIAIVSEQNVGTTAQPIGGRGLYLADADGSNLRQLIRPEARVSGHDWSPDGKHLAFMSTEVPDGDGDLGISIADIDEDGELTALHRLPLDPESSNGRLKWSPDGSQLAVLTTKGSREEIGVVDPDGSGFHIVWWDVTDLGSTSESYFWSPDGRSLVITDVVTMDDPLSRQIVPSAKRTWVLDVATGGRTEIQTPVETWQRLAP